MPEVNPAILSWARNSAGLSREEAVAKLPLRGAFGKSAVERLEDLESGVAAPTRPMLVKMARQYRRPLVAFYLASPPKAGKRGTDFRRLGGSAPRNGEAAVQALVRQVVASQSILRDVLVEEEAEEVPFVGTLTLADGREAAFDQVDRLVGNAHPRNARTPAVAFDRLRTTLHDRGVFVVLKGDLGSHHTALDSEQFRGFALADRLAPFIVINPNDARPAWSFTLVHELVHLLLGSTGISGSGTNHEVERFCNGVAAQYLLPDEALADLEPGDSRSGQFIAAIDALAATYNVSRPVVALGLLRVGRIDQNELQRLLRRFRAQWQETREGRRAEARETDSGFSPWVVKRHRAGKELLAVVKRALLAGDLSTTRAAIVLGVKPTQLGTMLSA